MPENPHDKENHMNAIQTETQKKHEQLLGALAAVGGAWARYGLTVGRTALETSARTLEATATALGQLAEAVERRIPSQDKAAPGGKSTESNADELRY
jgi:hypothetical protein